MIRDKHNNKPFVHGSVYCMLWLLLSSLLCTTTVMVRADDTCNIIERSRINCWPEPGPLEDKCIIRGCCWTTPTKPMTSPHCYFPTNYSAYSVKEIQETSSGIEATLVRSTKTFLSPDVMTLKLHVEYQTDYRLRIKIYDPNNVRYEVPIKFPTGAAAKNKMYNVTIQKQPFNIQVTRISTGVSVFDTTNTAPLIFTDQYIQISTQLTTFYVYGFGEHRNSFLQDLLTWRRLVFWNHDDFPKVDTNGYGTHNFYLNLESDIDMADAHGVFLLNSNAAEVSLQPYGLFYSGAVTYRLLGGIVDFFIVMGPKPLNVVSQFSEITGPPYMPPFWALGYHISKDNILDDAQLKAMIDRNRLAQIPFDTQWNAIDYMDGYRDWVLNKTSYGNLSAIVKDLHDNMQKYILVVDPGISSNQTPGTYPPFDDGKELGLFVKNASGDILIGKVWPGETAYVDFFHPEAFAYWYKYARTFHDEIPFDGIWLDMNEPSNFVTGSVHGCTNCSLDNPPYVPPRIDGGSLRSMTICPSAQHVIGFHYNLHNLYGWSSTNVTRKVLDALFPNKRAPIISRSTFVTSARHTGHWLGDNNSSFSDLYYSIPAVLNFNLFGIPFIGADVCGFRGVPTPELCTRWHQLAVFYPFMRNHGAQYLPYQDPASFEQPYQDCIRQALQLRYRLLAVLYTALFKAYTEGLAVVRPLFFVYPDTERLDKQFMWNDQLLVSPVLYEGHVQVMAYIPEDVLYDFYNFSLITQTQKFVLLDAPLDHINVHIRGGSILPLLPPTQRTAIARKQPFQLVVAPDANGNATGELFWDDGESADSIPAMKYSHIIFDAHYSSRILTSKAEQTGHKVPDELMLGEVLLLNITQVPSKVLVNGQSAKFNYSQEVMVLNISSVDADLLQPVTVIWT